MRCFARLCRFFAVTVLVAAPAYARIVPAIDPGSWIADAQVVDETNQHTSVRSLLSEMGEGSVVILPVYTRCAASCPLQTQQLKKALANLKLESVRVLVFSFDPGETAATIAEYRKREGVPQTWRIVHADESAIRKFFDFFHYSVLDEKGAMIHPDQLFVLDPSLHWRLTMTGLTWSAGELGHALEETRRPGFAMWLRTHPGALAWTGLCSIVCSVGLLCVWVVWPKRAILPAPPRN